MTEEKAKEALLLDTLVAKVTYSLRGAASEVLGSDTSKFGKYFQIRSGEIKDIKVLMVKETITDKEYNVIIPFDTLLKEESDRSYYTELRNLAKIIEPLIPEEEKKIPKDNWPSPPEWKDPPEEKKED